MKIKQSEGRRLRFLLFAYICQERRVDDIYAGKIFTMLIEAWP